jgi:hypothetical protein
VRGFAGVSLRKIPPPQASGGGAQHAMPKVVPTQSAHDGPFDAPSGVSRSRCNEQPDADCADLEQGSCVTHPVSPSSTGTRRLNPKRSVQFRKRRCGQSGTTSTWGAA